jgi:transposase-like protein
MSPLMAPKKKENTIDPPSSWKCPKCDNTATVFVMMNYPPACQSKSHKRDIVDMLRTDKP